MLLIQLLLALAFCSQSVYGQKSLSIVLNEDADYHERYDARVLVEEVLKQKKDEISEFMVVTFGNETVILRNKTDHWDNELINPIGTPWRGNVDHKMVLPAIKEALVASLTHSYVVVFVLHLPPTDDQDLVEEIKTLALTKQIQIFVIWEYDGYENGTVQSYKTYHQVAAASGGGVLNGYLYDTGIKAEKTAKYVTELIQEKRRRIDSTIIDGPVNPWKTIQVYISGQHEYTLVTATGSYVGLAVLDQNGTKLSDYKSHVVFEPAFQAVKLRLPAGLYTLNVTSFSDVHIMVLGWSEFTFELGFSTTLETAFNASEKLPTNGVETHLMVSVTNPERKQVESVQLLDLQDRILRILPLVRTRQAGVYATWKLLPPEQTFKIVVITAGNPRSGRYHPAKSPVTPKNV